MKQLMRLWILVVFSLALPSCGLRYIDAPPVTDEDRWIKPGLNKNDVWRALTACGYDAPTWTKSQQVGVDNCMLSNGFTFIDSPYGQQGAICKFPDYQHFPSCQSLKNRGR